MNDIEKYHGQVIEQRVVDIEAPPEPAGHSTASLIVRVLRRWYIILLVFVLMCGTGLPAVWFLLKPLYSVAGAIDVAPALETILTGETETYGGTTTYERFMYTQADIITSSRVLHRVADDLAGKNLSFFENYADYAPSLSKKLKHKLSHRTTKPDEASILREAIFDDGVIVVAPDRKSQLIKITMKSKDPAEATQIVNAFIQAYMAVEVTRTTEREGGTLTVLENERDTLTNKLDSYRESIRQMSQEFGASDMTSRVEMKMRRVSTLLAELTKIEAQRINLEAQLELLEQTKEQTTKPEDLLKMRQEYVNDDPAVGVLTGNIIQLEQELIASEQTLTATNPELERKKKLLEALKARLEEVKDKAGKDFDDLMAKQIAIASEQNLANARTALEQTTAYENRLREIVAQEDANTIGLGRKNLDMADLQAQMALTQEMHDTVSRRIDELKLERKRPARITRAYDAQVADVRDKRVKYTLALMFGAIACGMLLAFLKDRADLSLYTPEDIIERIGIRIIGTTVDPHAIKRAQLPGQIAGDYQTIRANLGLIDGKGMPKKLVVTSAGTREGKTTFAINLATSMAKAGKRVLLIDGDLRKPDIAHILDLRDGQRGLQDVLFGRKPYHEAIRSIPSTGLDVLAADGHNAADAYELLSLPLTAQHLNIISQSYDHVIVDSPPVLSFPDALVWAKIADAVVLTSFAGQTTVPHLKEAKEKLAEIDANVLGTVLSNVGISHGYYRYEYNYAESMPAKRRTKRVDAKLLLPMVHHE